MDKVINNKLQCGLALTVKESQDLYQYIKALEHTVWILSQNVTASQLCKEESEEKYE